MSPEQAASTISASLEKARAHLAEADRLLNRIHLHENAAPVLRATSQLVANGVAECLAGQIAAIRGAIDEEKRVLVEAQRSA